ncbi:hypothetical protein [Bacillus sp. Au-Bac7]|uniref:hypothetical protein n=1 Tax=Bacillus sp. Au-Bac7 TaxID=2906458 RepID=UPI001E311AEE|nr:hypothetical protein [Bacillus sp. Au-Bac7]MCE4051013.1 hypothetical protein [Bacillus sp. Au-Bac7]
MARGAGVTKVVWTGAKKNGNVQLYLSKVALTTIKGIGVAGSMCWYIINMAFQNYVLAARSMAMAIVGTISAGNTKNGRIYTVKSWKYKGFVNQ